MKIKILYLFLMLCVLACNKEKLPDPCEEIPERDGATSYGSLDQLYGYKLIREGFDCYFPLYHPTDPNQIIFKRYDHVSETLTLEYYNFQTGEQRTVFTPPHSIIRQIDWSVKDWIVFADRGARLWKIKSNGDSLTQLTFEYQNYYPIWSPDGNLLIHYESRKSDGTFLRVRDENMNIVKSYTEEKYFYGDWNKDNKIVTNIYGDLSMINYDTDESENILKLENLGASGVSWIPNSTSVVWNRGKDVRIVDYITKTSHILREDCARRNYRGITVSPDGKQIVITRSDLDVDEKEGVIYGTMKLVIMDIDGTNERVLNLN